MEFDPTALYRPGPLEVDVAGGTYIVPALTAADWLDVLLSDGAGWASIIPGVLEQPRPIGLAMLAGQVTLDELESTARLVLTTVAGIKWNVAIALAALSRRAELAGPLVVHGVHPDRLGLAQFLAACYHLATANMTAEKRGEFDMILQRPPRNVPIEDWYDEDEAANNFMAALAAEGGG